jgi:hypothetical protein
MMSKDPQLSQLLLLVDVFVDIDGISLAFSCHVITTGWFSE